MKIMWNPRRFKKVTLILLVALAAYALIVYFSGYPTICGTVVDAESGQPVEGAVALCVWTYTVKMIESSHRIAKVAEGITDSQGQVKINGTWNIFVDPPELTVYKRGYVAWNNKEKFIPENVYRRNLDMSFKRTDFAWESDFVAKMEKWKDEYSFTEHVSFIRDQTMGYGWKYFPDLHWEAEQGSLERERIREKKRMEGGVK